MKLDLKNTFFAGYDFDWGGGGGGDASSYRNASRDESVEAGDKSVEAGDESIEAGEKTPQSCYNSEYIMRDMTKSGSRLNMMMPSSHYRTPTKDRTHLYNGDPYTITRSDNGLIFTLRSL